MLRLVIQAIKIYQFINRLLLRYGTSCFFVSPGCNFYPSCSEYAIRSFKKYGLKRGLACSISRIFKCHPWTNPRADFS